jgi:hypothetical protein
MRFLTIPVLASVLITTGAVAADPLRLAPGKPAGVRKAQDESQNALIYIGLAAAGIGIALAVSSNGSGAVTPAPTTTSSTTTTG